MDYFLIALIIIVIVAIVYVWYITRYANSLADTDPLMLESENNKLLEKWYETNILPAYDFIITAPEIAAKFLERIYNLEINPNLIVVGKDLELQYYKLANKKLEKLYEPNISCIFNLRDIIGIQGEIAIIYDKEIREKMLLSNEFELSKLNDIMESNLDKVAYPYVKDVLTIRWEQLQELNNSDILNSSGSYLYIKIPQNNTNDIGSNLITLPENIIAYRSSFGARINLLCTNWEFEILKKRLVKDELLEFGLL